MDREQQRRHPRLDLFGEERIRCEQERMNAESLLNCITNIAINGADLILDRVFDNVGFNRIEDDIFPEAGKGSPVLSCEQVGHGGISEESF